MGTVLDSLFLAFTAIVTVCYQFVFFVITALLKFDKVTDFAGSTNFIILAALTLIVKEAWHFRQVVLTLFVVRWGLRLGLFFIDEALWVWTVSLPVTIVNATDRNPSLKTEDVIGWFLWAVGFTVEAMADQQNLSFKNNPANRGKWCNIGVWKLSRHPNYFGELSRSGPTRNMMYWILIVEAEFLLNFLHYTQPIMYQLFEMLIFLWWGIFVASVPVLEGAEWLVILGPIFLTLLLLFVSGIPFLEESSDKRFGSLTEYMHYKRTTSPLIPLPPIVYTKLPVWFKAAFLFEFPFYSRYLPQQER